ncbi:type IV pilin protein [Shewanella aestuarii]|uniref:Type IV pilin protein n=1 Tax=Shewanella aestuarii TaxID=1028752 RepID=A0A6G9QKY8_9GAMM|nr:type IV pilin protein [Shewanella aestuarii]QIR15196.1 type IV pilin protein [Shewanella aestuarii]
MKYRQGFTLIEVMITVVIVGILASIAYPNYTQYVARGARADALAGLMNVSNLQEQYYLDHRAYTDDMTKLGLSADPWLVENKHYKIDSAINGASFVLTATAESIQAGRDPDCKKIELSSTGAKSPEECW